MLIPIRQMTAAEHPFHGQPATGAGKLWRCCCSVTMSTLTLYIDEEERTPFLWAVKYRHVEVGAMLLEPSNTDPDTVEEGGRTLLLPAAEEGGAGVVEMLLKRNDVNPDTADKSGRTPLSWAARLSTSAQKPHWIRRWPFELSFEEEMTNHYLDKYPKKITDGLVQLKVLNMFKLILAIDC